MAREFDGPLTADDLAYLRARHAESYVDRMIDLYGTKGKKADSEEARAKAEAKAREEAEAAEAAAREAADAAQREADEAAAKQAEEDLIGTTGDDGGDATFDVLGSTESEVKEWAASASDEDKAAALAAENGREDRDPRKGVVSLLS